MTKLLDFVRRKVLGQQLYYACKHKSSIVTRDMLENRLKELHSQNLYQDWNTEDMIQLCKLKKKYSFAMDRFIKTDYITPSYYPNIQEDEFENISEEEVKEMQKEELESEYEEAEKPNCNIINILDILHQVLITSQSCFLQGAFVFSDKDGELFRFLTEDCQIGKRIPIFRQITHTYFLKNKKFNKPNAHLDMDFAEKVNTYFPQAINNVYEMYETPIQDSDRNTIEYNYACDVACRDIPREEEKCPEGLKATKRILLYYPFQVIHFNSQGNFKRRYLYLKLEETPAISIEHAKTALQAYLAPKTKVSYGIGKEYPLRRERKVDDHKEPNYKNTDLFRLDNELYAFLSVDQDDIKLYNDSVRSHYEMYIPQKLTDSIIQETKNMNA